jgi:DNA-binding Lrp family transcriptional regulator
MARAYLKIFIDHQDEDRILNALMELPEIKMADLTMGEQDIIAVLEAETFDDVVQIVLGQIRRIPGITRTVTNLAVSYK